jgi:hypothetical protein
VPTKHYDIHVSAYQLLPTTVSLLGRLGFGRDSFINNTRCDRTIYHGTFRGSGVLPDDVLWSNIADAVDRDKSFIGSVEQESFDDDDIKFIVPAAFAVARPLQAMPFHQPRPGEYKQCDIHVNVACATSGADSLALLDLLCLPSFDKPCADGIHRVFSITCDNLQAGEALFRAFLAYLHTFPNLSAKLKLERTDRVLRVPTNAPSLPILSRIDLAAWMAANMEVFI